VKNENIQKRNDYYAQILNHNVFRYSNIQPSEESDNKRFHFRYKEEELPKTGMNINTHLLDIKCGKRTEEDNTQFKKNFNEKIESNDTYKRKMFDIFYRKHGFHAIKYSTNAERIRNSSDIDLFPASIEVDLPPPPQLLRPHPPPEFGYVSPFSSYGFGEGEQFGEREQFGDENRLTPELFTPNQERFEFLNIPQFDQGNQYQTNFLEGL